MIINILKKHQISFFFAKLVIFLLLIGLMDFAIGSILKHFYFKQSSGILSRTTYSIESTNEDILIFGTSRANHHYISELIENELNIKTYNVGSDGKPIFYHYAVLNCIIKRYTPKIIIFDFYPFEFENYNDSWEKISSLLPYYDSHPEIREIIDNRSFFEKYKLKISKIYPYNSLLLKIAISNFELNNKRNNQESDIKGYIPLNGFLKDSLDKFPIHSEELDLQKIEYFENFIKVCNENKIKLYIFVSPYYAISSQEIPSINECSKIAKKYNIFFKSYINDSLFLNNNKFFISEDHLNEDGAKVYTKLIIEDIK